LVGFLDLIIIDFGIHATLFFLAISVVVVSNRHEHCDLTCQLDQPAAFRRLLDYFWLRRMQFVIRRRVECIGVSGLLVLEYAISWTFRCGYLLTGAVQTQCQGVVGIAAVAIVNAGDGNIETMEESDKCAVHVDGHGIEYDLRHVFSVHSLVHIDFLCMVA
jgi:hypothetical protein